ncbi:MAG: hypothetical protein HC830_05760 [Bacteroidetes bacterium]|nr:hypothetical protein [Bacteroidota bacterium]
MLYTTSNKSIDIKAAVDYAYKGAVNKFNVKVNAAFQKKMSEISVQVYQIGGDAKSGLATAFTSDATDLTRIKDFIVNGAIFSPENTGAPISYTVRSLKDNSLLTVNNTFSYDTKEYIPYNDPQYTDSTKVIDIDGNVYPIVKIGNQTWMAENLRTKRLNNGDTIPHSGVAKTFLEFSAMGSYGHVGTNNGLLYNYYTVNSENLCPSGWHVPSPNEWRTLVTELGGIYIAGKKLKAEGIDIWGSPNTGTDSSGFRALPGGWVTDGAEGLTKTHAIWWSSQAKWGCYVKNTSDHVSENPNYPLNTGLSVRCLRNE